MKSKLLTCLGMLCLGLSFSAVTAQTPSDGQFVGVIQIHVKPGMTAQYEAARKDLIAEYAKHKFSYGLTESRGENLIYRRVVPLDNWADLDRRSAELARLRTSLDPSIRRRLGEAVDHLSYWTFRTRPDLAYTPDNQRLSPEEVGFHHYVFLYLRRGTGNEFDETLKKLLDLRKKHLPGDVFTVARAVSGSDVPMRLIRIAAKDAADYYAQNKRLRSAAGAEQQSLIEQLRQSYRKLETSNNTLVPGLSYQPELPTN